MGTREHLPGWTCKLTTKVVFLPICEVASFRSRGTGTVQFPFKLQDECHFSSLLPAEAAHKGQSFWSNAPWASSCSVIMCCRQFYALNFLYMWLKIQVWLLILITIRSMCNQTFNGFKLLPTFKTGQWLSPKKNFAKNSKLSRTVHEVDAWVAYLTILYVKSTAS